MDETLPAGETVRTDDGVRLWAARAADGPDEPVVLCHGGPGLWDTLEEVAALLGDRPVFRWDQRGCGRSQRSGPYSTGRSVADLDAVRRHFGLDRMALLGHSWGAQLALSYALAGPGRVSALIYVSGTGIDDESAWHPPYREALRRRLGEHRRRWEELRDRRGGLSEAEDRELAILQWSVDFTDHEHALEHAEAMATPWFGVNHECNATINAETRRSLAVGGMRVRCAALDIPVLIVDGEADIRPRRAVDSLESALPDVTRTTLAGAGHLPWTEDPAGFGAAARAFLAGRRV
ncbi:alpha/beta hydrolase [Streptomyces sp. AK02-01A]|uniref:alpha/beta fold hydrolase n=1 Tax=Streptomyces sp. AK02-01A TaxID=3028648 RepID=UPI0029A6D194|nr:alpha/beta hydrolase [Streptomyces sp. AK02-01A]MDX3851570.1 alpha/beta hydrolase [Streptomyces sp. AK02-01A]